MKRPFLVPLLMPLIVLAACGESQEGGSNVTLRDIEVIDGTANDSMVDLDNVQADVAPMANAADPVANAGAPSQPAPANESATDVQGGNAE